MSSFSLVLGLFSFCFLFVLSPRQPHAVTKQLSASSFCFCFFGVDVPFSEYFCTIIVFCFLIRMGDVQQYVREISDIFSDKG